MEPWLEMYYLPLFPNTQLRKGREGTMSRVDARRGARTIALNMTPTSGAHKRNELFSSAKQKGEKMKKKLLKEEFRTHAYRKTVSGTSTSALSTCNLFVGL